jgi:hypothetical protein
VESVDKTDSADSLNQTHSSSDERPLVITSRKRSSSAIPSEEPGKKSGGEGSGDSTGQSSGNASGGSATPKRSNSLTRIKKQRSNPKILSSSQNIANTSSVVSAHEPVAVRIYVQRMLPLNEFRLGANSTK